jgi:hypothetical protein
LGVTVVTPPTVKEIAALRKLGRHKAAADASRLCPNTPRDRRCKLERGGYYAGEVATARDLQTAGRAVS